MGIVILLLLPIIWISEYTDLPGFYYRLLAAAAIVDATLTILAVILHRLYLQKYPELKSQLFSQVVYAVDAAGNKVPQTVVAPKRRMNPLLAILGLFLLFQVIGPIIYFVFGFWGN